MPSLTGLTGGIYSQTKNHHFLLIYCAAGFRPLNSRRTFIGVNGADKNESLSESRPVTNSRNGTGRVRFVPATRAKMFGENSTALIFSSFILFDQAKRMDNTFLFGRDARLNISTQFDEIASR